MTGMVPFFAASLVIHAAIFFFCGSLLNMTTGAVGLPEGEEDAVYVTVLAREDLTAQDEAPAWEDSPEATEAESKKEREEPDPDVRKEESKVDKAQEQLQEPPEESEPPGLLGEEIGEDSPILASRAIDPLQELLRSEEESGKSADSDPEEKVERKEKKNQLKKRVASLPRRASAQSKFRAARGRDLADFNAKIQAAIREAKHFPSKAIRKRAHGEATVGFTIGKDGSGENIRIVKSSGLALLDDTALEIVRKASKNFPPIPATVGRDRLGYVVPIIFKKKRSRRR
jgi:protein TonB